MQLKDQVRRNWKVVTAVTAVSAIGITGLALADPGSASTDPDPIRLSDRTPITQVTQTPDTTIPGVSFGTIDLNNDSPFDSLATATATPEAATPDESPSPSVETPGDSPTTASPADSPGSADSSSVDSP